MLRLRRPLSQGTVLRSRGTFKAGFAPLASQSWLKHNAGFWKSNNRFFSSESPGPLQAPAFEAADYPPGSFSSTLMQRCMDRATDSGINLLEPYEPSLPVDTMQTLILGIHDMMGTSWLAAIITTAICVRVVTLPISISAIRGNREKTRIKPLFEKLMAKQKAATGDPEKLKATLKEMQQFHKEHGQLWMLKGTGNLICVQVPLYLLAFWSMQGMARHPDVFCGFAMEAPLWLDSLALPDQYALLPLMTGAIMLTNAEIFGSIDTETTPLGTDSEEKKKVAEKDPSAAAGDETWSKYGKWIMRVGAVIFVPITWNLPSGVFVYMSTNVIFAAIQNRVLKNPVLERLLEIPPASVSDLNLRRTVVSPLLMADSDKLAELTPASGKGRLDESIVLQIPGSERPTPRNLAPGREKYRDVEEMVKNPTFAVQRVRKL